MPLDGILLTETLSESSRSVVTRGVDEAGRSVVIKRPHSALPLADCRPRFLNERMIYAQIESSRALRLREFIDQADELALVFEDPGCRSLPAHTREHPLGILDSLRIALGILDALVGLHRAHVVHRDVKPDNVLVDASLSRVLLIDFGIASVVERTTGIASTSGRLEGTVEFIAPELTGRVNRGVDYRSDYYCLGATLYWMLAGESPFGQLGLSELVHAHIARTPERLDARDPAIPPALASIVAKLLAKSPDERYQGAFGLRRDLERCIEALERGEPLQEFALAVLDPSERLTLTRRVYGRARECELLQAAHERARSSPELVVISGPAGCGKTTLVEEFRARLRSDRGDRVQFMQHKLEAERGEPMAAVKNTLSRLLRHYERGPEPLRDEVHRRLHEQLDEAGAALAEVLPEIGRVLGPRPALPVVDPGAARARFWASVGRYADALLLREHEYVLFVDDLQWADEASRHLVEHLLDCDQHVLVIATVRDEDSNLDEIHAWLQTLSSAHQTLELGSLDEASLREWSQALLGDAAEAPAFAQLLSERTRGIPLFVEQSVVALHDAGAISIDHETGRWTVDLARARAQQASGDAVEFLVGRLRELSPAALSLLGLAAHVGARFDRPTLAALAGVDEATLATSLYEASAAGFLLVNHQGDAPTFTFAHERLRRAAAQNLTQDPAHLHLALARRMLESEHAMQDPEITHGLVSHVALASKLITEPHERAQFAQVCLSAAQHARAAAAFVTAALHYGTATRLLDDDVSHERLLESLLALAECQFMAGQAERGAQTYVELRALVRTRHELTRVLLSREQVLMVGEDTESCLETLVEAAALFELDVRRGGSPEWVGALMQRVLASLAQRDLESIRDPPLIRAPELEVLLALLQAATKPAYVSGDLNLMTALTLTIIELSLEHGFCDAAATAFMQLALLCATALADFEGARRYSAFAFALFERFPDSVQRSVATMIYAVTVQPWIAPVGPDNPTLREQFHELRNAGMLTDAGYAINTLASLELLLGAPLETTLRDARAASAFLSETGARSLAVVTATTADACGALLDHEHGVVLRARDDGALVVLHPTDVYQSRLPVAFVAWILRDDEAFERAITEGRPARMAGTGLLSTSLFDVFESMLACASYAKLDAEGHRELTVAIDARFAQLERWQASCPTNATPLRLLLAGVWAQARGLLDEAFIHFDAAGNAAADAGWVSIEARVNEHAADVLVARGQPKLAVGYFEHARRCYARWGARAALRRLGDGPLASTEAPRTKSAPSHTSSSDTQLTLDIGALVKMAETMSNVTSVEEVVIALLDGTVQNAGADRGVLLLDQGDGLHIAGVFERDSTGARHVDAILLADASDHVAVSLVNEAASGTQPIVVDDGPLDERVANDPWVVAGQPRSLLALPIVKQDHRVGVLYLENSMLGGVFSGLDLQILTTLARQAAIALDNARLFDALREREAQWRSLVDNAPDFIAIVDRNHRFEFVNRFAYGFDAQQVLGMTAEQFLDPTHAQLTRTAIEKVFADGTHEFYEAQILTPGGVRHISTRLGPIKRGDVIERVTLITADRTHQHQLEEQLRQAQKMQAIGTLAGGVAHDFNNLLTVVLGACELAMMQVDDPAEVEISLADIRDAAERAANLTRQLLAFSRRQVLNPKRVDLNALVSDIAKLLRRLIGENIELRPELTTAGCGVHVDPSQLEQVLMNLVVNARDAMPDGGVLTLRTRRVRVDLDAPQATHAVKPGDYVVLEVEDTGLGITAEALDRIFEPFFTTKPAGQGTGLGLSTVLGIVEQSGGSLFVDSEPGRGTRFLIYLPFGGVQGERATLVPAVINEVLERKVILVVEDERAVRGLTARMLRGLGYEVEVAGNGDEAAVVAAQADVIDLLLVDVVMPGANGREVADRIGAQWPNMKVLYMSGYTDDAIVRLGVLDGTRTFLQKPFSRVSLAHAIDGALRDD